MKRRLDCLVVLFLAATALGGSSQRVHLLPKLQPGQILFYLIRFQADKNVKTESRVVAPVTPDAAPLDAHGLLRVQILDVQQSGAKFTVHARSQFISPDPATPARNPPDKKSNLDKKPADPAAKPVDFTISQDGSVHDLKDLDSLPVEQQQAWLQWVARFAMAWTLPTDGVKLAEKWKSDEFERVPSPISGLQWARDSVYVKDEPCQPRQLTTEGDISPSSTPPEPCAVLLTNSILNQTSSPKDTTPQDFRLHDLRTMGIAKGTAETITYISINTGLVVRATEETTQSMDVLVAKADGSNRVQYHIDAKSHAEILLVTDTPPSHP